MTEPREEPQVAVQCDVCGQDATCGCDCPECPECGVGGRVECYLDHGMTPPEGLCWPMPEPEPDYADYYDLEGER